MSDFPFLSEEEVRDVLMNEDGRTVEELRSILERENTKRWEAHQANQREIARKKEEAMLSIDLEQPGAAPHKDSGYGSKYTVKSGDSLGKIVEAYASHYGTEVTPAAIAAANKIQDPNKVQMGSVLNMSKFVKKD